MNSPHLSVLTALLLAYLLAVAITDLRSHRIPNRLTVPAALVGLILNITSTGGVGALTSVGGLLVGLGLFVPFYLARGFGAGDVKAMAATGAFLGPQGALFAAAGTLIVGAVFALIVLVVVRGPGAVRALATDYLTRAGALVATGRDLPPPVSSSEVPFRFPYGLAIAFGTLASLAWS